MADATNPNVQHDVWICRGTGCVSAGSDKILEALHKGIKENNLTHVKADFSGCHGFCQQGPIMVVEPEGIFYCQVKEEDVPEIVQSHFKEGKPVERLFYKNPVDGKPIAHYMDIPFYAAQQRLVLRNCGHINPEKIEDCMASGAYTALRKCLNEMTPDQIIEEIKKSGLRGRGGAGFPTWQKWSEARTSKRFPKYIVCNADEGDPGAFMDRSTLEADPHTVLEGMIIAAYAVGAQHGYIYVRAEYPLAVERLFIAVKDCLDKGFLGDKIMGKDFSFHIEIMQGAGAFVCGEGSALMYSLEGKRGMPRVRPPRSVESGVWGLPTSLNNVKTFAVVPVIINKGADWYASIGVPKSPGTAVFALTGKIANAGLVEVPMGTPLRKIVFDAGGGILGGKKFKAVQTGGPSGGCLPASLLDLPVEFESLTKAGSMMGSGGMVIVDEETCMVDLARYFLDFTVKETCGKCIPCREGTSHLLYILESITKGLGMPGDIEHLLELCETIQAGSLCGLGKTAPNPVLSTIRYFRDEYEAHINERRCPAKVCKMLTTFYIMPEKCQGCGICVRNCPVEAIAGGKRMVHVINQDKCIKCGTCIDVCPARFAAVTKVSGEKIDIPKEPTPVAAGKK